MKISKNYFLVWILALGVAILVGPVFSVSGSAAEAESAPKAAIASGQIRPESWAVPVTDGVGLPNLFKVSDVLYRGAQPEEEGYSRLKAMGIKSVVNLRSLNSKGDDCNKHRLKCMHLSQVAWWIKTPDVIDFLKVVTTPGNQPVFVHCRKGSDRTGVMIAAYRVVVEGWSKEEAIREMTEGGYGFNSGWKNLVKLIRNLDEKDIRKRINLGDVIK